MALQKQLLQLELGPVDQREGNKHVVPGRLVLAENVRRDKEKLLKKRDGHTTLATTKDTGGNFSRGQELASDGRSLMALADDAIYLRDAAAAKWTKRGAHIRVSGSYQDTVQDPRLNINGANAIASAGGYLWLFWSNALGAVANQYMVIEEATGAVIKDVTTVGAAAPTILQKAIVAGGFVWLFIRETTTTLVAYKFNPSTPTSAPTSTTYLTVTGSTILNFDVLSTVSGVAVGVISAAAMATPVAGSTVIGSFLNTGTGLPAAAWVSMSAAVPLAISGGTLFAWIKHDGGSPANFWFLWHDNGTGIIKRTRVSITFTAPATVDWYTPTSTTTVMATGFYDTVSAGLIGFIKDHPLTAETVWEKDFLVRVTDTGAVASSIVARGTTLVSEMFTVTITRAAQSTSQSYIVTMHLNYNVSGSQSTYQLRDSTGRIVGKLLYGQGGGHINQTAARNLQQVAQATAGGRPWLQVGRQKLAVYNKLGVASWRFNEAIYGSARTFAAGRRLAWPGSWPQRAGSAEADSLELGPAMYPRTFTLTEVGGGSLPNASAFTTTVTYVLVDSDGNEYESAPSPPQTLTTTAPGNALQLSAIPTMRFTNSPATVWVKPLKINVWCTRANGSDLLLYATLENDVTVDTTAVSVVSEPATYARKLYTTGGVLSNDPPPPFNWCFEFKDRLFLGGTDVRGELWPSHTYLPERGPEFSAINVLTLGGGTGELTAGGVVDDNYAVIFREDAIFAISGPGPNRRGEGNYEPQRIEFENGATNPASVVSGPGGCYYQATDGDWWVCTHTLERVNISRGIDTYKGATVKSAAHVATKNQIRWEVAVGGSAYLLVLDYGFPTQDQPFGQWYVYTNLGEPWYTAPANGACVHDGVYHRLEEDGGTPRPEVDGQFTDKFGSVETFIKQRWTAAVSFAGVHGYARFYRGVLEGLWKSAHFVKISVTRDDEAPTVHGPTLVGAAPARVDFKPRVGKGTNWEIAVSEEQDFVAFGEGFQSEGMSFEVGVKKGARRLGSNRRI